MRKTTLTIIAVILASFCFAQEQSTVTELTNTVKTGGISLGSAIAAVASWDRNKSILWAILHGIFSWFYVIYFALTRK